MAYLDRPQPKSTFRLSELSRRDTVTVHTVREERAGDPVSGRLRDLGFVAGEDIRVVARAPFGGDPLVVQVGFTRFALRRAEAARIMVAERPAARVE